MQDAVNWERGVDYSLWNPNRRVERFGNVISLGMHLIYNAVYICSANAKHFS